MLLVRKKNVFSISSKRLLDNLYWIKKIPFCREVIMGVKIMQKYERITHKSRQPMPTRLADMYVRKIRKTILSDRMNDLPCKGSIDEYEKENVRH